MTPVTSLDRARPAAAVADLGRLVLLAGLAMLLAACGSLRATGPAAPPPQAGAGAAAPPPATRVQAQPDDDDEEMTSGSPQAGTGGPGRDPDGPLPNVDLTREILFQVVAAEVAVQRGQVGAAINTYLALARTHRDSRLARRATELALSERSLERALQAAQLWYSLAPESASASQTVEALWLATDRFGQAEPLLAARLARARADGTLAGAYQQLLRTLSRASDKQQALGMLERLSQPDEGVPEARMALAALAAAANQPERAAAESSQALRLRPEDERIAIAAAQYIQATKLGNDGARELLGSFLRGHPQSAEARYAFARLLAADGRTDAAREQMELALKQAPDNPGILFAMAQLAYELKQPAAAEGYLRRYVELPRSVARDNGPAYLFLAQLAEDGKRYAQAIVWLEKVSRGDQRLAAITRRALLLGRLKRIDEGRELLRGAPAGSARERAQLISAEAQLLREAQRFTESFDVLEAAVQDAPGSTDLLYDHAMAADKLDRVEVMERSLRKLIELKPDHAHAYNALGYTFADRNLRLDEAKALIEKALSLAPDDPHIIDSMGWVLYRQGKLDDALQWLRRAYAIRPEPDVAAHLGEVLWKAGQPTEARKMWRSARGLDPDNETLKETLARLNVDL